MKRVLLLLLSLSTITLSHAQNTAKVSGKLVDSQLEPLPFATVMLLHPADSALVQVQQSDINGQYIFDAVPASQYLIGVSMLGYEKTYSNKFEVPIQQSLLQHPTITVQRSDLALSEVQVVGHKPLIEHRDDMMIMNVANSLTVGATAAEALQKVPGLVIMNDRISIAGREGVTITIDGKTSNYTDVITLLKNIPSSNIERIEVINHPNATYDAAGKIGIINIRMKKNTDYGTNGSIMIGSGYGRFLKYNGNININHRSGRFNVFGNYGYNFRKTYEQLNTERKVIEDGEDVFFYQKSYQPRASNAHTYRLGVDYEISKKQILGVLMSGYSLSSNVNGVNSNDVEKKTMVRTVTNNHINRKNNSYTGNLNYRHSLDSSGHELAIDLDAAKYNHLNNSHLINKQHTGYESNEQMLRSDQATTIDIGVLKSDYRRNLSKSITMELGAKVSMAQINSDLLFEKLNEGDWKLDNNRSNYFKYNEHINAAYINLKNNIKNANFQLGLRAEQTGSKASSVTSDSTVESSYLKLFPNLSVTTLVYNNVGLNFTYHKRIDRPSYQDLNPSITYLDPYTMQKGNPFLKPQLTNSFKASIIYKKSPFLSLEYNHTKDIISLVTSQEDSIMYTNTDNLNDLYNYSATINFPINFGKSITGYGGINIFYNNYRSNYLDSFYDNARLSTIFFVQNNIQLPKKWAMEVSGFYHTKGINGLVNFNPFYVANIGVQKTFWNDKAQLRLSANDIFFSNKQRGTIRYDSMNINFITYSESQQIRLSCLINFGNKNVKSTGKRTTASDIEKNRVKQDKE